MAKAKDVAFFCKECGYESSKWLGQCPACKEWNSFVEEPKAPKTAGKGGITRPVLDLAKPVAINEVSTAEHARISTHISELDRVLGGGIVPGSLVLVGGDPGIGKSTILLQMCRNLAADGKRVLYISGEESAKQIRMRADRMGAFSDTMLLYCETNLRPIEDTIRSENPDIVIIDSIQTMFHEEVPSSPGSVTQVREATNVFLMLSKGLGIPIFLVGHVTKEGVVAGPRVLEHMVDTVLYFEGERSVAYRLLRAVKNRFGSTNEIGVFEMQEQGLVPVANPSEYMLKGRPVEAPGSVVTCAMEGTRPVLLEIQALVARTNLNLPRRNTTGADPNRVQLLTAVLEKKLNLPMYEYDVYINIAGGMRIAEPSLDLGILTALISSYRDLVIPENLLVFGEVGLTGEVRQVSMAQQRLNEAAKLGFSLCMLPAVAVKQLSIPKNVSCIGIEHVADVYRKLKEFASRRAPEEK